LPEDDAEALSILTAELYDAALDRALWPAAMSDASCFMESFSSVVYEWSRSGEGRGFIYDDGELDPEYQALYHDRDVRLDPVTSENHQASIEEPFSISDVLDAESYRQSAFYREWSGPQHIVDLLTAPMLRTGRSTILFGAIRHERDGAVDEPMRRRMRLLAPHMRRALALTDIVGTAAPRAAEFENVLDGLRTGVFLADAEGRVLHANAAGNELLAEGDALRARNGRLSPSDLAAASALSLALEAAGNGTLPSGDSGHGIALAGQGGDHFAMHLLPLVGGRKRADGAAAAVFVQRTTQAMIAPDLVGRAFGLTPAEQRVLAHIVEAGSVAEAAERLRVSETTVKTHLHRVFSKTGTARQADLVKLLTGFAGPLR
jgi:DNA-binding CsgD family transcriptional regulator/PAS domain-containing protein